jgi:hypothetical protein
MERLNRRVSRLGATLRCAFANVPNQQNKSGDCDD